jgi:hypothetical protein
VQIKIVDFLDDETERIDALIDKKRRMIVALNERMRVFADGVLWSLIEAEIPLMYAVQ